VVTGKTAKMIWSKLAAAEPAWFATKEGRRLVAKSLVIVRNTDGRAEAVVLRNLLTVVAALPAKV
jgi:hypothetical protein